MTENSTDSASHLFRDEAIEHHFRHADAGDLLDPSPLWTSSVLWVSAVLIVAAALFLALAEIDVTAQIDGVVRIDAGQVRVVASLADQYVPYVHVGDAVRIGMRASDRPAGDYGFGDGVVVRIAPGLVPATESECASSSEASDKPSGLEVALSPAQSGSFAVGRLRSGSRVSVQLRLKKQRLFDVASGSLLRER